MILSCIVNVHDGTGMYANMLRKIFFAFVPYAKTSFAFVPYGKILSATSLWVTPLSFWVVSAYNSQKKG